MGHVWLLGGAPNVVAQPQNIFERVASCAWTSSPTTVSYVIRSPRAVVARGSSYLLRLAWPRLRRQPRLGLRVCQGVACSYAWAARKSVGSSSERPISCSPIGRPAALKPQGTEMAGSPVMLAGMV